jgi:hypothetical protein
MTTSIPEFSDTLPWCPGTDGDEDIDLDVILISYRSGAPGF